MLLNKEEMIDELRQGVILVNFTKANGERRDMRCTLNEEYLPHREDTLVATTSNDEAVVVWDVEKNDWRSFRLDRVNHVFNPAP